MIIMVSQADPRAPCIPTDANWNTKGDVHKLRNSFTDHELRFRRVLYLMKPEDCRLWRLSTLPDLPTWVSPSGRVVIAGDVAHTMFPYLAQGLAMAVEDGATLAECLARAKIIDQIPTVLRAHETIRKPRAEKVKAASERSGVEKHYPDGEQQEKRDVMMKAPLNAETPNIDAKKIHSANWLVGLDVRGHVSFDTSKNLYQPN
jgi:salicylate hydroxylase